MTSRDIICPITVAKYDELTPEQRELVDAARGAVEGSYAPYSNFHVGAAIRLEGGEIITGANQENAASPSSLCAERTAAYWAGANRKGTPIRAIAIAARDATGAEVEVPISPCGACRQALLEYETLAGAPMQVLLAGRDEILILPSIQALLPLGFTPERVM